MGKVKQDITLGTVITSQAFLCADTISHRLSDNPNTTKEKKDRTKVSVKLENGAIYGKVEEYKYKAPISAKVSINGPCYLTKETDNYGKYHFSGLPPGTYQVIAFAEGYEYHLPDTFITVEIDGSGKSVQADFLMKRADSIPPQFEIDYTMEQIIQENITKIIGTASDLMPGSGLNKYDAHGIVWDTNNTYTIQSRATDKANNVGTPYVITNIEDSEFSEAIFEKDLDQDGVDNSRDNCLEIKNPDQLDTDKDTAGDAYDPDEITMDYRMTLRWKRVRQTLLFRILTMTGYQIVRKIRMTTDLPIYRNMKTTQIHLTAPLIPEQGLLLTWNSIPAGA